ncbi:MAG TPA: glycosyltransferase family 4 protein, partial [Burkholderiales bacterium]|nr:glycosyltransferase family 4 protein [Burkholderiales bacterium]
MNISFSATNPCHVWPTARAVAQEGVRGIFYSGYPVRKLPDADARNIRSHSLRTNIVYGLLKYIPEPLRPSSRNLFLWQDRGLDRWISRHLEPCDFIHAMPGQALETFQAAKRAGIRTVLNHATGPVRDWIRIMEPEYQRVGLKLEKVCPYDSEYLAREDEEYALADFHCVASTVVRDQLVGLGIPAERIWMVPYGADTNARVFQRAQNPSPPPIFRILFAGQISLRKGIRTLLDALTLANRAHWKMDFIGSRSSETAKDIAAYRGATALNFHGALPQQRLARAMRESSVLVLPSLEEGFGLVVPQALNCACPCIVSDRVGGHDYVRHRENGSIFPVGDPAALTAELEWWEAHPARPVENFTWTPGARTLI